MLGSASPHLVRTSRRTPGPHCVRPVEPASRSGLLLGQRSIGKKATSVDNGDHHVVSTKGGAVPERAAARASEQEIRRVRLVAKLLHLRTPLARITAEVAAVKGHAPTLWEPDLSLIGNAHVDHVETRGSRVHVCRRARPLTTQQVLGNRQPGAGIGREVSDAAHRRKYTLGPNDEAFQTKQSEALLGRKRDRREGVLGLHPDLSAWRLVATREALKQQQFKPTFGHERRVAA
jgi:hypothetical protein